MSIFILARLKEIGMTGLEPSHINCFIANKLSIIIHLFADPFVDIDVRSEGCDDPGKAPNTCGIAYIKVDGKDYSFHGRGHNVVVVDSRTGILALFCHAIKNKIETIQ